MYVLFSVHILCQSPHLLTLQIIYQIILHTDSNLCAQFIYSRGSLYKLVVFWQAKLMLCQYFYIIETLHIRQVVQLEIDVTAHLTSTGGLYGTAKQEVGAVTAQTQTPECVTHQQHFITLVGQFLLKPTDSILEHIEHPKS